MNFRPYTTDDYAACLAIFDSNVPMFFAPEERAEFSAFPGKPQGAYFVLVDDGGGGLWRVAVIAKCGGLASSSGGWCGGICTDRV